MPIDSDALVGELRDKMSASTNYKKDAAYINQAAAKLDHAISLANDPKAFAAAIYGLMRENDTAIVGEMACKAVLSHPDGQQIGCEIGKQVLMAELRSPSLAPQNFLRTDHALVGFTKEFMNETAPGYKAEVHEMATEVFANLDLAAVNNAGPDLRARQGAVLAGQFMDVLSQPAIDPPAQQYLKGLQETAMSNDPEYLQNLAAKNVGVANPVSPEKLAQTIVTGATALRIGSDTVLAAAGALKDDSYVKDCLSAAQRTANTFERAELGFVKENAAAPILRAAYTDNNRQKFADVHQDIANATAPVSMNVDLAAGHAAAKADIDAAVEQNLPALMIKDLARQNGLDAERLKAVSNGAIATSEQLYDAAENCQLQGDAKVDRAEVSREMGDLLEAEALDAQAKLDFAQRDILNAIANEVENPSPSLDAARQNLAVHFEAYAAAGENLGAVNLEVDTQKRALYNAEMSKEIGPLLDARGLSKQEKAVVIKAIVDNAVDWDQLKSNTESITGLAQEAKTNLEQSQFSYQAAGGLDESGQKIHDAVYGAMGCEVKMAEDGSSIIQRQGDATMSEKAVNTAIAKAAEHVAQHGPDSVIGSAGKPSVRERLSNAVSTVTSRLETAVNIVRAAAATRLEAFGNEQKLRQVPAEARASYEELQDKLSELNKKALKAVDPAHLDIDALDKVDAAKAKIKKDMAELKADNPGLAQLDRNVVSRNLHSAARDTAKAVGQRLH